MSAVDVVNLLEQYGPDPDVGLAVCVNALRNAAKDPEQIRVDFNFITWKLSGVTRPTTAPNVMFKPTRWSTEVKSQARRTGVVVVEVSLEYFDAEPDVVEDNVMIVATALAQFFDGLRGYSDVHQGTVLQVLDPLEYQFGNFAGATSAGLILTTQIQERSAQ